MESQKTNPKNQKIESINEINKQQKEKLSNLSIEQQIAQFADILIEQYLNHGNEKK